MQTFDVSTNILDSQLSFFQRGKNLRTQPPLEETVPSVLPVSGEPAVRALPICGLRINRHDLLKLVLTQVVVLALLILIVALKS